MSRGIAANNAWKEVDIFSLIRDCGHHHTNFCAAIETHIQRNNIPSADLMNLVSTESFSTPLHMAITYDAWLVDALFKLGASADYGSAIYRYARNEIPAGQQVPEQELLTLRPLLEAWSRYSFGVLHSIATPMLEVLLKNGCDPNIPELNMFNRIKNEAQLNLLFKYGADVSKHLQSNEIDDCLYTHEQIYLRHKEFIAESLVDTLEPIHKKRRSLKL